jgi:tetratricopeptide (TPR) repeat protein
MPAQGKPVEPPRGFQHAVRLFQQGRLDQAKAVCKPLFQKELYHFELLCLLGVICYQQNENTEALEYLKAALNIDPNNLTPLSFLGQAYESLMAHWRSVLPAGRDA